MGSWRSVIPKAFLGFSVGLIACSDEPGRPEASTPDASAPDLSAPDAGPGRDLGSPPLPDPSGRRLQAVFAEAEGGARVFVHYWDTELAMACLPAPETHGVQRLVNGRCWPLPIGTLEAGGVCAESATWISDMDPGSDARWARGLSAADSSTIALVSLGERVEPSDRSPACTAPSGSIVRRATVEDGRRLVGGRTFAATGIQRGRILPISWFGEDTSRGVIDFEDAVGSFSCRPDPFSDSRCLPLSFYERPVARWTASDRRSCQLLGAPPPRLALRHAFGSPRSDLAAVGPSLVGPERLFIALPSADEVAVSRNRDGQCGQDALQVPISFYRALVVEQSPPLSLMPRGQGLRAFVLPELSRSVELFGSLLYGANNQRCRPFAVGAEVVCAEEVRWSGAFADVSCTVPALEGEPAAGGVFAVRTGRFAASGLPEAQLFTAGTGATVAEVFMRTDTGCAPAGERGPLGRFRAAEASEAPALTLAMP